MERRRTAEQFARRAGSCSTTCFGGKSGHDVFISLLQCQTHQSSVLESLVCLLEGMRAQRFLVLVDSRVVLGAVTKGRSSSRKLHFLLRKLAFWCLAYDIALIGCPHGPILQVLLHGTNRSKAGTHRCRGFLLHRPRSLRQPITCRSWNCSVNRCRRQHRQRDNVYRSLNPPVPSDAKKRNTPTMRKKLHG